MSYEKLSTTKQTIIRGEHALSSFEQLRENVHSFVKERDWQVFHTPKNLAMCLSVEASELLELYQWQIWQTENEAPGGGPPDRTRVEEEVGDILISLINFCDAVGIDPIESAQRKLLQVKQKYPVDSVRGSAIRPKSDA